MFYHLSTPQQAVCFVSIGIWGYFSKGQTQSLDVNDMIRGWQLHGKAKGLEQPTGEHTNLMVVNTSLVMLGFKRQNQIILSAICHLCIFPKLLLLFPSELYGYRLLWLTNGNQIVVLLCAYFWGRPSLCWAVQSNDSNPCSTPKRIPDLSHHVLSGYSSELFATLSLIMWGFACT